MYAVIRTGGKQYKVTKDAILTVESLAGDVGSKLTLGEVLMLGEVVPGVLRGVGRQGIPGGVQRRAGHRQGGLGHGACGLHTYATPPAPRRFSTEQHAR